MLELLFDLTNADKNVLVQLLQLSQVTRKNITTTMGENLLTPVSLNELAYLSGRSLSSFKRDFLATYKLLANTTMSVTDVCYTTGFENIAHFYIFFKSHFSYKPLSQK